MFFSLTPERMNSLSQFATKKLHVISGLSGKVILKQQGVNENNTRMMKKQNRYQSFKISKRNMSLRRVDSLQLIPLKGCIIPESQSENKACTLKRLNMCSRTSVSK